MKVTRIAYSKDLTTSKFERLDGVVLDADENAARNILARNGDPEIGLWTPYREVRLPLQERTEHWLSSYRGELRLGLLNQDSSCVPKVRVSTESEMSYQPHAI